MSFVSIPAFANVNTDNMGENISKGSNDIGTGAHSLMDGPHQEASKGRNTGEHLTGLVAGGAVGARSALHQAGAGVINILTFWIPKKQPLINPGRK